MIADTIINGDSAEVLKTFPADCIDLTVTSPPYDNLRAYNGYMFDFETIARELYRVTKPGGVVVWVVGDATIDGSETGTSFRQALYFMQCGFNLHDTMIFEKDTPPSGGNRYQQMFDFMFVFSKVTIQTFNAIKINTSDLQSSAQRRKYKMAGPYTRNKDGTWPERKIRKIQEDQKIKGNIWYYLVNYGANDIFSSLHPAPFPEALARDHILSWSNPGDLVLDPFFGSGTTGKMAKEFGRHYVGIEISAEYVELAQKRIAAANVPLFIEA